MHHNNLQESEMTTRTTQTLSEQLKNIKPQVRTVPKVEVRRVQRRVFGGYEYDVQYVKPTWEALSKRERAQFLDLFVL